MLKFRMVENKYKESIESIVERGIENAVANFFEEFVNRLAHFAEEFYPIEGDPNRKTIIKGVLKGAFIKIADKLREKAEKL